MNSEDGIFQMATSKYHTDDPERKQLIRINLAQESES